MAASRSPEPPARAGTVALGVTDAGRRHNGGHGTTHRNPAPRRLRGKHRRYRRCRGDARQLPRICLLGHLPARTAGRPGRPEAGAAPDPVPDERDGPAPGPRPRQVRPGGRRGDGAAAPARRQRHLRRAGPDGAALGDAAAADRWARQLRLTRRRRLARRHAVHRGPADLGRHGDGRLDRRGHRRLPAQLRRHRDPARGAARWPAEPAGQRHRGHRGRDGHQHGAAQPRRGDRRGPAPHRQSRGHPG